MLKQLQASFGVAFRSIQKRFFHTLLSVLGIVIGVAALVATLSLIDGLEVFAKKQIAKETNINMLGISSKTSKLVNNVPVSIENFPYFNIQRFTQLSEAIPENHNAYIALRKNMELHFSDSNFAARTIARNAVFTDDQELAAGTYFSPNDVDEKQPKALVNQAFVNMVDTSYNDQNIIGTSIQIDSTSFTVIGVLKSDKVAPPSLHFPITLVEENVFKSNPPQVMLEALDVEDVPDIKAGIESYLDETFPTQNEDFSINTYENYAKDAKQGFQLFRLVMGMIVGLSVLVGGIGVMNVLLISVTERTQEIGVRKALGANRRSIISQFLSESIAISIFGSILGLILGMLFSQIAIQVIKQFADVPFGVAYTGGTMFTIAVVAILIGILFGTYPALKAAKLDPVEAIRRT